jgi:geranylgeranyl diphosphate synthase type II
VHSAVGLELLHNAFLVHDDVEDESEERRGRPTLHAMHGVSVAVNVGDALALLGLRALIDNRAALGPRLTMLVLEEAERMARESIEGQAMELGWRRDNALVLDDADYLVMVLKKTCWYTTIYPVRVGALIGTLDGVDLERYLRFGFFLGAAFQIQDDLLNLTGDFSRYGKEIGGDIKEGKRTLMLIHLLQHLDAGESARITRLLRLSRDQKPLADIEWVRRRMDDYGSIHFARQVAHGLAGAALHEHELAFAELPDSRDKRFLEAMPRWVLARS